MQETTYRLFRFQFHLAGGTFSYWSVTVFKVVSGRLLGKIELDNQVVIVATPSF
jgi:hypothetical protein